MPIEKKPDVIGVWFIAELDKLWIMIHIDTFEMAK